MKLQFDAAAAGSSTARSKVVEKRIFGCFFLGSIYVHHFSPLVGCLLNEIMGVGWRWRWLPSKFEPLPWRSTIRSWLDLSQPRWLDA
jgi:hypothetical protein